MSTHNSTDKVELGERLRWLRGDESQTVFSERVGITRSALANYETGRTTPKISVLRKITQRLGIAEEILLKGVSESLEDFADALGARTGTDTLADLTKDEKAIVRLLRICDTTTVHAAVDAIVSGLETGNFSKELADPLTIVDDIARLFRIAKSEGVHERGITKDGLTAIMQYLGRTKAGN